MRIVILCVWWFYNKKWEHSSWFGGNKKASQLVIERERSTPQTVLSVLVRLTYWQTGLKSICQGMKIKLQEMKDLCSGKLVIMHSYPANTYFKKSKNSFQANNRAISIPLIALYRGIDREKYNLDFT